MRVVPGGLLKLLNSAPTELLLADLYTFTLVNGAVYRWTDFDNDITINGNTFLARGPVIQRSGMKWSRGLNVEAMDMTLADDGTDGPAIQIGGLPLIQAFVQRQFDGATVQLDRVFAPPFLGNEVFLAGLAQNSPTVSDPMTGTLNAAWHMNWGSFIYDGTAACKVNTVGADSRALMGWPGPFRSAQFAQITISALDAASTSGFGPAINIAPGSAETGYCFYYGGSGGTIYLVKLIAGAVTVLNSISSSSFPIAVGDVLRLENDGLGNLTASKNGITILTAFDNALNDRTFGLNGLNVSLWRGTNFSGGNLVWQGPMTMFLGRMGEVKSASRSSVEFSVECLLNILNIKMPRNLYQPSCRWTLFDAGCTLSPASFTNAASVLTGSTASAINATLAAATDYYALGRVIFTSGANNGLVRSVKAYTHGTPSVLTLSIPLPNTPGIGDTFNAIAGCNKTMNACLNKFNNLVHIGSMPFIPSPETAI